MDVYEKIYNILLIVFTAICIIAVLSLIVLII